MKEILSKLIDKLKNMIGEELSLCDLITEVYGVECKDQCTIEGKLLDDLDLIDLSLKLDKEAKRNGLLLDESKFCGCVGMPYNIPFVVKDSKKIKNAIKRFNDKIPQIEKLSLEVAGFFSPRGPIVLTFEGEKVIMSEKSWGYEDLTTTGTLTIKKQELFDELKKLNIGAWDKEYIDISVDDGTGWEFVIYYNDGKKKKYEGLNDYPYNFDDLCQLFGIDNSDEEE